MNLHIEKNQGALWSTITLHPQDQASGWEERATHLAMSLDAFTMKSFKPWLKAVDFLCHTERWCKMGWSPHAKDDHAARAFALGSLLDRQRQMGCLKVGLPQIHWFITIFALSYLADTRFSNKSISSAWSLSCALHLKFAWLASSWRRTWSWPVSLIWSACAAVSLATWRTFFPTGTSVDLPHRQSWQSWLATSLSGWKLETPGGINVKHLRSSNMSNPSAQSSVSSSLRQSWLSFAQLLFQ